MVKLRWITGIVLILLLVQIFRIWPFLIPKQEPVFDILILGGKVVDGSGGPSYEADIGINGTIITEIGKFKGASAKKVVNAEGLVVAPGFINPHSHSDQTFYRHPEMLSALMQGITSEIVGNDGFSSLEIGRHLQEVEAAGLPLNYGTLIGHSSIREEIMGNQTRQPTDNELEVMVSLVEKGMKEGALGFSTGLEYPPGQFAATGELIVLAEAAGFYGGIYVSHIRNERDKIIQALQEALLIGQKADLPVHISHIKVAGEPGWPPDEKTQLAVTKEAIDTIHSSIAAGFQVTADMYPYTVPWFLADCLLSDEGEKYNWNQVHILSARGNPDAEGKSIAEAALEKGTTPQSVYWQLLADDPEARAYVETISEESIISFIQEDFIMVAVDASAVSEELHTAGVDMTMLIHPRAFGTYPRVLARYVREEKIINLEEAIHKMTGLTARTFGLTKRGLIKKGYFADLVIFNPDIIADVASYTEPARYPLGIEYVLVNGQIQIARGKPQIMKGSGQLLTLNEAGETYILREFN